MNRYPKILPAKGTVYRPAFGDQEGYRSLIATGGNSAATSTADAGSATLTFAACQEDGVLERMIFVCNAAVSLVAGADASERGVVITSIKVKNDELIGGGNVPAALFSERSLWNPPIGKPVDANTAVSVTYTNNTGATIEATAGATIG